MVTINLGPCNDVPATNKERGTLQRPCARVATEKRLPFEPLVPNEETIEAMRAARRGDLVDVGGVDELMADLNAED